MRCKLQSQVCARSVKNERIFDIRNWVTIESGVNHDKLHFLRMPSNYLYLQHCFRLNKHARRIAPLIIHFTFLNSTKHARKYYIIPKLNVNHIHSQSADDRSIDRSIDRPICSKRLPALCTISSTLKPPNEAHVFQSVAASTGSINLNHTHQQNSCSSVKTRFKFHNTKHKKIKGSLLLSLLNGSVNHFIELDQDLRLDGWLAGWMNGGWERITT